MYREVLKECIVRDFGIGCFNPANGETLTAQKQPTVEIYISSVHVHQALRLSTPAPSNADTNQQPFEHEFYARLTLPDSKKAVVMIISLCMLCSLSGHCIVNAILRIYVRM